MKQALVMFGGESCHPFSWTLKKGFSHCFVILLSDSYWIKIEKLGRESTFEVVGPTGQFSMQYMKEYYIRQGYKVIQTKVQKLNTWKYNMFYGNIMVANCVGLVKAVLSLNSSAITPYSLYKDLTK